MKIDSLNDLKKLFKLCQVHGVTEMSIDGMSFKLNELQPEVDPEIPNAWEEVMPNNPYEDFPQDMLTAEQLAHYAAGGKPEDDPTRND